MTLVILIKIIKCLNLTSQRLFENGKLLKGLMDIFVSVDKPKFLEEHKRKEAERMAELQEKAEKERLGFQTT